MTKEQVLVILKKMDLKFWRQNGQETIWALFID